jgi:hypothetical protein
MKTVLAPFRQLVARRLWPVALLLVVAVVAVPRLLAEEDPAATSVATAAPVEGADPLNDEDVVSLAGQDVAERRRVLGARKDPFRPSGRQPEATRTSSETTSSSATATRSSSVTATGGSDSDSGGSSAGTPSGGSPAATAPAAAPTPAPATPKTSPLYSLSVRFDEDRRTLERLDPLPDAETPSIIYLGLLEDRKTAVFLLDENVVAEGDGSCHPSPADCQRLHLRKGETEFFEVGGKDGEAGAEHQLDLLDVRTRKTASAARAGTARAAESSAGRRALRSRIARVGRLRYDARTGLLDSRGK